MDTGQEANVVQAAVLVGRRGAKDCAQWLRHCVHRQIAGRGRGDWKVLHALDAGLEGIGDLQLCSEPPTRLASGRGWRILHIYIYMNIYEYIYIYPIHTKFHVLSMHMNKVHIGYRRHYEYTNDVCTPKSKFIYSHD